MSLLINVADNFEMKPRLTILGVGGAGGNAVNNMISGGLDGVEYWAANTDVQALELSLANKIRLGKEGLGAGSYPEVGRLAAEESAGEIIEAIEHSNMLFITAGMGGGTGTGAAPVVAKLAHERNILTVGVVTKPFHFEGIRRMKIAEAGLEEMYKYTDTLIVIHNQNLFRIANENTTFADAFRMADNVLHSGVRGIVDLINKPGLINLDFADVRAAMKEMGKAMMGTGEAQGENRASKAAEAAISNPLLDTSSMKGARGLLINITGGLDMTLFEVDEIANRIREEVSQDANIIIGSAFDESTNGSIRVSIVATGIEAESYKGRVGSGDGTQVTKESEHNLNQQKSGGERDTTNYRLHSYISHSNRSEEIDRSDEVEKEWGAEGTTNRECEVAGEEVGLEKDGEGFMSGSSSTSGVVSLKSDVVMGGEQQQSKSSRDFFEIPAFLRRKNK
ncbi:cell division protein FtsZ [Rickettsiales endosymbiont of Peranema trichophorum]|uniref:cell division protein FtsZ n=1 Tax=Rickettsiales endosymbiont of Peranema trichophorum TaxID=2486577 RepID=UPI001023B2C6|nr:cell division protein FtsZ [Rickettsiales endosymbiont of Peranema trichophorum]RZI46985.1 cell division protein FtsZ [Rickettsiales endosymbiont of Peranema trichophorum]